MKGDQRFYFSLRSPYSWLALEDLQARHHDLARDMTWLPYWDPEPTILTELAESGSGWCYAEMSRQKHFYILQDVRREAGARGLPLTWPVDRYPRWEVPHLACLAAARYGRMSDLAMALTRARWYDGLDICNPTVVASIAQQLSLDGAEMSRAVLDPTLHAAGVDVLRMAYDDGVFGVPFFVDGRSRYWGVERLDAFANHLDSVSHPPQTDHCTPLPVGQDTGHAGGCG